MVREWLRTGVPSASTRAPRAAKEVFTLASILSAIRSIDLTTPDAEKIAQVLKDRGLLISFTAPGSLGSELFTDFLTRFWTYEKSPYVEEKLAHGQRLTHEHCYHSLARARRHWFPKFKGKRLAELTKADIKAFSVSLASPKLGLAPGTRNRILIVGTTPLRWAYDNGLICTDITVGLVTFSGANKKRGIPTPEEAARIFQLDWTDERAKVASLVAATTGLRISEICALRAEDIDELVLQVCHGWTPRDGLKTPKNGEARRVPLLPDVRTAILELLRQNPHGAEGFVFWDVADATKPCTYRRLANGLKQALVQLQTGKTKPTEEEVAQAEKYWKERAVTFHSWRHYYAARMADKVEARTLMLATGHKTRAVFDHYAEHALESDLARVAETAAEVFSNILSFESHTA